MKEKRRIFILAVVACFCTLVMQAQEVKSVSLDSIPKASLPKEGMSLEYSRPSLGGFPVLQGKSYYSESNAPWMSEEGRPLEIAPNAIPHISLPSPNLGTMAVYSSGIEVPGLMNRQTAGVVYQQNFGRFCFFSLCRDRKDKHGSIWIGQSHQSFFWWTNGLSSKRLAHSGILWTICSNENL